MLKLTPEDSLTLFSVKINPSSSELEYLDNLIPQIKYWDYLIINIIERGVAPLFFRKVAMLSNRNLIPTEVFRKLKLTYYTTLSRNHLMYEYFTKVAEVFYLNNVKIIAFKGIYLAEWLYKDIGLRQFSDIDLLINYEDSEKSLNLLDALGYKPYDLDESDFPGPEFKDDHYKPRVLNDVAIELHVRFDNILPTNELINNSIQANVNNLKFNTLCFDDTLIQLCVHLDKHFSKGRVQFTCFTDITNLLDIFQDSIDWTKFESICRLYNCEILVFKYIILINKYFNASIPDFIYNKYSTLLLEKDEILFLKYLKGSVGFGKSISTHLSIIKSLDSFRKKSEYLSRMVFPSKSFMIRKYKIKRSSIVPFYYLYRYFIGFKGLIKFMAKRK